MASSSSKSDAKWRPLSEITVIDDYLNADEPTHHDLDILETHADECRSYATKIIDFISNHPDDDNSTLILALDKLTRSIKEENPVKDTLVGLVGQSGTGKSTLINAIIGTTLLPEGAKGACTAAVSEIRYNVSDSPESAFRAVIHMIPKKDIITGLTNLIGLVNESLSDDETYPNTQFEADLYNDEHDERNAQIELESSRYLPLFPRMKNYQDFRDQHPQELYEEILQDREKHTGIMDERIEIISGDVNDFRNQITPYMSQSAKDGAQVMNLWCLTSNVEIFVKSDILKHQIVLVDIPGTRDINTTRVALAESYIDRLDVIFMVCSPTRATTDPHFHESFLTCFQKMMIDGRLSSSSMAMIISMSDLNISGQRGIDYANLHMNDSTMTELIAKHDDLVAKRATLKSLRDIYKDDKKKANKKNKSELLMSLMQLEEDFIKQINTQSALISRLAMEHRSSTTGEELRESFKKAINPTNAAKLDSLKIHGVAAKPFLDKDFGDDMIFRTADDTSIPLINKWIEARTYANRKHSAVHCINLIRSFDSILTKTLKRACVSRRGVDPQVKAQLELLFEGWLIDYKDPVYAALDAVHTPVREKLDEFLSTGLQAAIAIASGSDANELVKGRYELCKSYLTYKRVLKTGSFTTNKTEIHYDFNKDIAMLFCGPLQAHFDGFEPVFLEFCKNCVKEANDVMDESLVTLAQIISDHSDQLTFDMDTIKAPFKSAVAKHLNCAKLYAIHIRPKLTSLISDCSNSVQAAWMPTYKVAHATVGNGSFKKVRDIIEDFQAHSGKKTAKFIAKGVKSTFKGTADRILTDSQRKADDLFTDLSRQFIAALNACDFYTVSVDGPTKIIEMIKSLQRDVHDGVDPSALFGPPSPNRSSGGIAASELAETGQTKASTNDDDNEDDEDDDETLPSLDDIIKKMTDEGFDMTRLYN